MFNRIFGINVMYDADDGGGGNDPVPELDDKGNPIKETDGDETLPGAGNPDEETPPADDKTIPYGRFKEKVDEVNVYKAKVAAFEKEQEDAKTKQLEEEGKWKDLYDQAQETIKAKEADALLSKKQAELIKAGYTDEQSVRYVRYLDGETDDEISASIEVLKADVPPVQSQRYADPSLNNGPDGKPSQPDATSYGRDLLNKALGKK